MRHPEEIPKTYRRKGIRQKRTKEGRRHEGKTAAGRRQEEDGRREEAFLTKSALLPLQDWRTNKAKGLIQVKNGGKTDFWNENNTN